MKITVFLSSFAAAAVFGSLTSCDSSPKARPEAPQAAVEAEKAGDDLKEKADAALEAGKDLGASALGRVKEMAGKASDYAKEKVENLPELEAVTGDIRQLLEEGKQAVKDGVGPEKRAELQARWDAAEAKVRAKTEELSPVVKEKANAAVDAVKNSWNALMRKAEEKAGEAQTR